MVVPLSRWQSRPYDSASQLDLSAAEEDLTAEIEELKETLASVYLEIANGELLRAQYQRTLQTLEEEMGQYQEAAVQGAPFRYEVIATLQSRIDSTWSAGINRSAALLGSRFSVLRRIGILFDGLE